MVDTSSNHCIYIIDPINNITHFVIIYCKMHANQSFTRKKRLQLTQISLNESLTNGSESSLFYSSLTNSLAIR